MHTFFKQSFSKLKNIYKFCLFKLWKSSFSQLLCHIFTHYIYHYYYKNYMQLYQIWCFYCLWHKIEQAFRAKNWFWVFSAKIWSWIHIANGQRKIKTFQSLWCVSVMWYQISFHLEIIYLKKFKPFSLQFHQLFQMTKTYKSDFHTGTLPKKEVPATSLIIFTKIVHMLRNAV